MKKIFRYLYSKIRNMISNMFLKYRIYQKNKRFPKILEELRTKDKITVAFFVVYESCWKAEYLYRLLENDKRFKPIIIACPVVNQTEAHKNDTINAVYTFFLNNNYNVIKAYDEQSKTCLDIKNIINPDIVFYTNPYRGLIHDDFYILNYLNKFTAYIPYFYTDSNEDWFINQPLQSLVNRFYAESSRTLEYINQYQKIKGNNVIITGYPGLDQFFDAKYVPKDRWRFKDKKRIIWAPHHTLDPIGKLQFNSFIYISELMVELAKKYKDQIEIVFKPHPLLRAKLEKKWGKKRTDEYYYLWESMENTSYENSDYIDLFLTSDAMIHDSGSFTIEYLCVNKPVMRTDIKKAPEYFIDYFNDFTLKALEQYYRAYNIEEIEPFIVDVVINGNDVLKESRTKFVNENLRQDVLPSQRIFDSIVKDIWE